MMKMPKGLERLRSDLSTRLQKTDCTDNRQLRFELNASLQALDLMKEMAEALELCTEYYPEIDHLSKMEEMRKLNASLTLKKFKEWK